MAIVEWTPCSAIVRRGAVGADGIRRAVVGRESVARGLLRPHQVGPVAIAVWIRSSVIVPRAVAGAVGIQPGAVARVSALLEPPKASPAGTVVRQHEAVMVAVVGEPGQGAPDKESAPRETGKSNVRAQAISPI